MYLNYITVQVKRGKRLIVHVHNPTLAWVALIIKVFCPKIVFVGNLHTDWRFLKLRHKIGMNLLARVSKHLICVSDACKTSIPPRLRQKLIATRRVSVIRNGIDSKKLERYRTQFDSHFVGKSPTVAIVVARMVEAKNCFYILDILAQTAAIDRLIWFGDGIQKAEIVNRIKGLGIQSRVTLMGNRQREEVFKELAAGSLYLSASKWEGIGVANLEAAALGCPVFLSKIPPHDEIAKTLDICTYPLNDVAAWTKAINTHINSSKSKKRAENLRISGIIQTRFDLRYSILKYLDVYFEVSRSSYV